MKKQIENDLQGLMLEQDRHVVSDDMVPLLNNMEQGLQRVTDIVQNMTVFSHVNYEHTQLFNVNHCIETAYKRAKKQINEGALFEFNLQDLPDIEINMGKINQVIANLMVNASQATENAGKIKVSSQLKDKQILVIVSDSGCGIEKSELDKIFDPFYTTKKERGSTGLGLAIAYDIALEHGGNLSVVSAVGKGSVFTLSLPLVTAVIH